MFSIKDTETAGPEIKSQFVQLRARVVGDLAIYSYSIDDGATFTPIGSEVKLAFGWWKGARPAIFAFNPTQERRLTGLWMWTGCDTRRSARAE